jgi:hypothetical protein
MKTDGIIDVPDGLAMETIVGGGMEIDVMMRVCPAITAPLPIHRELIEC